MFPLSPCPSTCLASHRPAATAEEPGTCPSIPNPAVDGLVLSHLPRLDPRVQQGLQGLLSWSISCLGLIPHLDSWWLRSVLTTAWSNMIFSHACCHLHAHFHQALTRLKSFCFLQFHPPPSLEFGLKAARSSQLGSC